MIHPEVQTTRRSAGLPLCLTALIQPESAGKLLPMAMPTLLKCLESLKLDESSPSSRHVHALNCLRALFKHAALASHVQEWLGEALSLCFRSFGSASWPIRNGSLMLLASLLNRAFGSKSEREDGDVGNRVDIRLMLKRLPSLPLLIERAAKVQQNDPVFTIFPLLSLLQRLNFPPSSLALPEVAHLMGIIHPLLSQLLGHPQIKVRRMTGRILVAMRLDPLFSIQSLNWLDGKLNITKEQSWFICDDTCNDPTSPAYSLDGLDDDELLQLAMKHYRHEGLMSKLLPRISHLDLTELLGRMSEEWEGEGTRLLAAQAGERYPALWHRWLWDDEESVRRVACSYISRGRSNRVMSVAGCLRAQQWPCPQKFLSPTIGEKDLKVLFEREPLNQFIDLDWESRLNNK